MHPPASLSRFARPFVVMSAATLLLVGCSSGATTVEVTLQEWAVLPDPGSVSAGDVTFSITNDGPEDVHEFVVIQTDLDPGDLPTDETGAVSEDGEGMTVIGEVEDVAVGATEELPVSLEPGNYVLICNIYSAEEDEAHYAMGMRVAFTVTE